MTAVEFSIAGILLAFYGLLLFIIFLTALVRGVFWRRRSETTARLSPEIREAVVDYLSGSEDQSRLKDLMRTSRQDVSDGILAFQRTVGGAALDRLCNLALTLGLVDDWLEEAHSRDIGRRRVAYSRLVFVSAYEPCRRVSGDLLVQALNNSDPEIWLTGCQAMIQWGTFEQVQRVFELSISESLLIRILLSEGLRRHSAALCEQAVPVALRSTDPKRVLAALEILVAWERAVTVDNLSSLLEHPVKAVRLEAFQLAPLVPLNPENRAAIVQALADPDPEVSMAAALSAGKMQIAEALPALARMLRLASGVLGQSAADALSDMPPKGWQALEELSASSNPVTAAAAAGALERARRRAGK